MSDIQLKTIKPIDGVQNPGYDASPYGSGDLTDKSNHEVSSGDVSVTMPESATSGSWSPNGGAKVDDGEGDDCCAPLGRCQTRGSEWCQTNRKIVWYIVCAVLILLYAGYFAYAMYYSFGDEGSIRLLWCTCLVVFIALVVILKRFVGDSIDEQLGKLAPYSNTISWVAVAIIYVAIIIFVIVDVAVLSKEPYNLVSAAGILVYVILFFIFSYSPSKVQWRAVAWGLALQFVFAIIILKWEWGFQAFEWLGTRVSEFLTHTDAGSKFVFGDLYTNHFFAFKVLPTVIFFSTIISVLYYLGAMQAVIRVVAWVMQILMGTTAAESLNAAANIFIGQSEAPLMIRPLIQDMTRSELHAVMTGGFATIAGTVLAAYISFGVPANHLLSASVMSAPAALAMAKLFYPETQKSKTTAQDVKKMEKSPERNIVEAASSGASQAVWLALNIGGNLIAFIALLQFVNTTLTWFGQRVGVESLTFEFICSYVLWPLAIVMGVNVADCRRVAELIGIKTFLNEFVAFQKLGDNICNKMIWTNYTMNYNWTSAYVDDDLVLTAPFNDTMTMTLPNGILTERSEVISTYALCGFANFGSIGIMLGALGAMAPERKSDLASVAVRAMIAGNVACFMTACIAGLFYNEGSGGSFGGGEMSAGCLEFFGKASAGTVPYL